MTTLHTTSLCRRVSFWYLRNSRQTFASRCSHRHFSNGIVEENDLVILKRTTTSTNTENYTILTPPLRPGENIKISEQKLPHDEIIGKRLRDTVLLKRRKAFYRITEPTLGEYTNLSPRVVTPIYSQDADAIVNLLDLHPSVPGTPDSKLEIFEAGTGHGSLTLRLSRAIHGANTSLLQNDKSYETWLENRRAVIETLDINSQYSQHAQKTVKNFKKGMYYHNINFHVGTIEEYISSRLSISPEPFLSHAILDLPDCHTYMELVAKALKPGGNLIVFCPSITQINVCALDARNNGTPLHLEKVVELGASIGVGGREWDVRPVRPRAFLKARAEAAAMKRKELQQGTVEGTEEPAMSELVDGAVDELVAMSTPEEIKAAVGEAAVGASAPEDDEKSGWELVCRPKVGERVVGGGFVGLWKKMYID